MSSYTTISPDKLARLIGTANAPVLIDVRTEADFAADVRGGCCAGHRRVDRDRAGHVPAARFQQGIQQSHVQVAGELQQVRGPLAGVNLVRLP